MATFVASYVHTAIIMIMSVPIPKSFLHNSLAVPFLVG